MINIVEPKILPGRCCWLGCCSTCVPVDDPDWHQRGRRTVVTRVPNYDFVVREAFGVLDVEAFVFVDGVLAVSKP